LLFEQRLQSSKDRQRDRESHDDRSFDPWQRSSTAFRAARGIPRAAMSVLRRVCAHNLPGVSAIGRRASCANQSLQIGCERFRRSRGSAMENGTLADDVFDRTAIERCRVLLAEEADDLSDNDVDSIGRHAEALARVIVEMFLAQRAGAE